MKKHTIYILLFSLAVIFLGSTGFQKEHEVIEEGVNWLTFEEAIEKSKTEKKKIFIDVYTDWCGWCKVMDKNTFSDPTVAKYLNENYYPVKLDAEQKEEINFKGNTFKYVPSGRRGYHELAAALLQGKMSYPSFVILNEKYEIINITKGYQKREPFHKIISFYKEEAFKNKETAQAFEESYQSPF
ncbi:MAG: DUF255 domain-containing protein [Fulvivirga sp.]|nr:DUF255 domain-containing protein [Fulvivirga sp.]